jgi:hypothetical protein
MVVIIQKITNLCCIFKCCNPSSAWYMTADGVQGNVSHRISIIKKYNKGRHYSISLQPDKWLQMVRKENSDIEKAL